MAKGEENIVIVKTSLLYEDLKRHDIPFVLNNMFADDAILDAPSAERFYFYGVVLARLY